MTLSKKIYNFLERHCHNANRYILRHDASIEIFFIVIYTLLNVCLAISFLSLKVTLFVIGLLFFIYLERIILHVKLREKEKKIKENYKELIEEYGKIYTKDRNTLVKRINNLKEIIKKLSEEN